MNFRDKRKKDWTLSYMSIDFMNGKKIKIPGNDDAYNIGFYKKYFNRPICHTCPFAKTPRLSDITIADFWGIDETDPKFANKEGTSLMLINTKKGQEVFGGIGQYLVYKGESLEDAVKFNSQLYRPAQISPMREDFMADLSDGMSFENLKKKYLKKRPYLKRILSRILSIESKKKIKTLLKMK